MRKTVHSWTKFFAATVGALVMSAVLPFGVTAGATGDSGQSHIISFSTTDSHYTFSNKSQTYSITISDGEAIGDIFEPHDNSNAELFDAWIDTDSNTEITDLSSVVPDSDKSYRAKFRAVDKANDSKAVFYVNGGSFTYITDEAQDGAESCNWYFNTGDSFDEIGGPVLTKDGAGFSGWYLDEACTQPVDPAYVVQDNDRFYAGWDSDCYQITMHAGEGYFNHDPSQKTMTFSCSKGMNLFLNGYINDSSQYTESGKFISGIYEDAALTKQVRNTDKYYPAKDTDLYVKWEEGYKVTFDYGIAADAFSSDSYPHSYYTKKNHTLASYRDMESATYGDYIFDGWYLDSALTQKVTELLNVTISTDITFYAKWAKKITVVYNAGDGKFSNGESVHTLNMSPADHYLDPNYACYSNTPGKALIGWGLGNSTDPIEEGTISLENLAGSQTTVTLNAIYGDAYDVTFDLNGGTDFSIMESCGSQRRRTYTPAADKPITLSFPKNEPMASYRFISASGIMIQAPQSKSLVGWSTTTDPKDIVDLNFYKPESDTVTLHAIYDTSYVVSIDANGGYFGSTGDQVRTYTVGNGQILSYIYGNPNTDEDLAFVGWNTAQDGSGTSYTYMELVQIPITGNITFYAQWKPAYTVVYHANGGVFAHSPASSTYETKVGVGEVSYAANIRKSGRALIGWSSDAEGKNIVARANEGYKPTKSISLYAVWGDGYNITYHANNSDGAFFDINGYTETDALVTIEKGQSFTYYYPRFVNNSNNLVFAGYNTKPDGSGKEIDYNFVPTGHMDVYAQWKKGYNIRFHANGGYYKNTESSDIRTITVAEDDSISLTGSSFNVPRNESSAFSGWSMTANGKVLEGSSLTIKSDLDLYAIWEDGITLTFEGNGGGCYFDDEVIDDAEPTIKLVVKKGWSLGDTYIHVYKEGYSFRGWSRTPDGEADEALYDMDFTESMTLYAVWEKTWKVTFDANGGKFAGSEDSKFAIYSPGKKITCFPNPTFSGKAVSGWYTNPDGTGTEITRDTVVDKDMTVYAKWDSDFWTVTLDAGEALFDDLNANESVHSCSVAVAKGKQVDIPADDDDFWMRNGSCTFIGWYEDPQFKKPVYVVNDDEYIRTYAYTPTKDVTLYAKVVKNYKVTFDGNGGYVYDFYNTNDYIYVTPGRRIGYTFYGYLDERDSSNDEQFTGWYKEKECKTLVATKDTIANYVPTGDITLYAGYQKGTVKVNGVSLTKKTFTVGIGDSYKLAPVITPGNATNKKMTFASSDTAVATVDEDGTVTGLADGKATITITTEDGGFTATCEFTVDGVNKAQITANIDNAKTQINSAATSEAAKENVTNVLNGLGGVDKLADKVEGNDDIAEKLEELETAYVDKANINVVAAKNEVNENALEEAFGEDVDANDISASGLGLNAEPGKTVKLDIEATPENEKMDIDENKFTNAIQVNIEAKTGDSAATANEAIENLVAPITITLPMPTTIPSSKLYVLHFYKDGTFELIKPKLIDNKMVITVSHFSTFAIVELANGAAIETNDDNNNLNEAAADNQEPTNNAVAPTENTPAQGAVSAAVGTTTADKTGNYTVSADYEVTFTSVANKKAKSVKISDTVVIDGQTYKVTAIANGAFKNCKKLTKVTIGKNITKIGSKAFANCGNLKTITIKSKDIKSIGKNAFKGIKKGATIKVPKSKKKEYTALLKKAKLPKGVKIK